MIAFQKFIILIVLFLIASWFYWFQYRPSEIKKTCFTESLELVKTLKDKSAKAFDFAYTMCLHEKGL